MLDVAQEELTGETLWRATVMPWRAILMTQFVGDAKKALEKKYGKGSYLSKKT
jgi:hypothetical protein